MIFIRIVSLVLNFFLLTLIFSSFVFSQTDSTYIGAEEFLEDLLQEPDESQDNSNLYEIVEQLILNPIDINSASISELQEIPGVEAETASLIFNYRKKYGSYFSSDELNAVRGLNKEIIKKIKPFVIVKSEDEEVTPIEEKKEDFVSSLLSKTRFIFRSRYSNDLQNRKGFTDNRYLGTKFKSYNRLLFRYNNNYQMGLLFEKDPGESSINEFSSYHFSAEDIGILKKIIIGDYLFEFGQGIALWSPYGFSKGADAIYPVKKKISRVKPYTSATENNFFRGAAGSVNLYGIILTAFFSRNEFDANIDSVTGDILSRPIDGFHRTLNEISRKRSATETIYGSSIDVHFSDGFKAGLLHYRTNFSNNLLPLGVFEFEGSQFDFTSIYYDFIFNNINIFGEIAYNGKSIASINSLSFFIGRNFSFVTSLRSYPRNFVSLHGFAFGERSGAATNEFGIYTGIKWRTLIGVLNFYYDQFKFPFATFSNPRPGSGEEFFAELVSKPFKRLTTKVRYKYEQKDVTKPIGDIRHLVKRIKQLARLEIIYHPVNFIRLKGRFDYNSYHINDTGENENGYSFFQDVRYSANQDLNLYLRLIFYRTKSFNSAIYEYENDLTGVLSNNALFGEGIRWYFILRYKPLNMIALSLKYSETYKPAENSISSGLNEIKGNIDNRISFQLDLQF